MNLHDLCAVFYRHETNDSGSRDVCVVQLEGASGMFFRCPRCTAQLGATIGVHAVRVPFDQVKPEGHDLHDLTLPEIQREHPGAPLTIRVHGGQVSFV